MGCGCNSMEVYLLYYSMYNVLPSLPVEIQHDRRAVPRAFESMLCRSILPAFGSEKRSCPQRPQQRRFNLVSARLTTLSYPTHHITPQPSSSSRLAPSALTEAIQLYISPERLPNTVLRSGSLSQLHKPLIPDIKRIGQGKHKCIQALLFMRNIT
jgi:hypothetical protein